MFLVMCVSVCSQGNSERPLPINLIRMGSQCTGILPNLCITLLLPTPHRASLYNLVDEPLPYVFVVNLKI